MELKKLSDNFDSSKLTIEEVEMISTPTVTIEQQRKHSTIAITEVEDVTINTTIINDNVDPGDKESEFDWGKNDTLSLNKRKRGCFSNLPVFLQNLLYAFFGSSFFMSFGLISYFFFVENKNVGFLSMKSNTTFFAIDGLPVLFYSVWLAISWSVFFGIRYVFTVLPSILVHISNSIFGKALEQDELASEVSHYIDYVRHLKKWLTYLIWSIVNLIVFVSIFSRFVMSSYQILFNIFASLNVFFGFFLAEKFLIQIFAVRFHQRAFSDRIQKQKFAEKVLDKLAKARKRNFSTTMNESSSSSSSFPVNTGNLINNISGVTKGVRKGVLGVAKAAFAKESNSSMTKDLQHGDPYKFAKKTFEALQRGNVSYLTLEDFIPYFKTKEEAAEAFLVFDKDGNGDIDKIEMKNCIIGIYQEHEAIELSVHQSSQAISKLDSLFKVFVYVAVLFIVLGIFNINTSSFLTVAISLWAGLLFALGGTVKNLVEAIIFLFLTHPYDVGDRIDIEGSQFVVKEFGLLTTIFTDTDGKEIYAPNPKLAGMLIHNIRRSGPIGEGIKITIDIDTTKDQLEKLTDFLVNYLETEESREFFPVLKHNVNEFISSKSMIVSYFLNHKHNWQDNGRRVQRRNRFMLKLREGLVLFGIQLSDIVLERHQVS
ncbi:hypothetical protein HDU92_003620 [Lobulomyces angularis]|nr:hypothetical protein HDU92_003620 [Lobulomyces angularis]